MTRRRRLLAYLASLGLPLALVACAETEPSSQEPHDPGRGDPALASAWTRLPDPPLSPRSDPVTAWVAGGLVVVGGSGGPPCPPNADCAPGKPAADGAVYDPGAQKWRTIADAPRPIAGQARHTVVEGVLYLLDDRGLLAFDATAGTWDTDEVPGAHPEWRSLSADGDLLVVASGSDEQGVLADLVRTADGRWSELPPDPLGPSFDRYLTATSSGLVLTAKRLRPDGGPTDPALVRAALLPPGERRWERLPDSDQLGGWRWTWTGNALLDPSPGGADGGETNNYGRVIPYGGRLDPATGTWSALQNAPADEFHGGWPVEALDGDDVAVAGWLYEDEGQTWRRIPRPDGAPDGPGPAAWGDGRLYVVGGSEWDAEEWSPETAFSPHAWVLTLNG